jgi:hypothetical protein
MVLGVMVLMAGTSFFCQARYNRLHLTLLLYSLFQEPVPEKYCTGKILQHAADSGTVP